MQDVDTALDLVTCPSCSSPFELTAAMQETIARRVSIEQGRIRQHAEASIRERVAAETRAELDAKDAELAAMRAQAADALQREADVAKRARDLDDREQRAQLEIEHTLAAERSALREQAELSARERYQAELGAKDAELADARARAADAAKREVDIAKRARDLDDREQRAQLEVEQTLAAERTKIRQQAEDAARARFDAQAAAAADALNAELADARARAADAAKREVGALQRTREMEAREQAQLVVFERRLTEMAAQTKAAAEATVNERLRLAQEQHEMTVSEHNLQIDGLKRKLAEAQQKISAPTAYIRGEAQEIQLRELLVRHFQRDRVEDVPVGAAGSDVVQGVVDNVGREIGTIIWESKNTKTWNDEWLVKLRDDQRAVGAEFAVIASTTLPPDVRVFALRDGVWVTSWHAAAPLASVLRRTLIDVAAARNTNTSRGEKMSMLYDYLTGADFRNRFTGVVESYQVMQEDLERERRAILAIWKKRERQLERARKNLTAFYGDVQGIAGAQLPDIVPFMLPTDDEPDDAPEISPDLARNLTELLFELIPVDATIGNKSLCSTFIDEALMRYHVDVGDGEYQRCKDMLLRQDRIRRGSGQGGSVARI